VTVVSSVPAVTFIIPAFNAAETLGRPIASLAAQTRSGCWRAIVVDDGSADSTLDVARQATVGDERISVLARGRNGGAAAARNTGLAGVRTELVAFLDADDSLHPSYLARMLQTLRRSGADAVCCGVTKLDRTGRTVERRPAPRLDTDPAAVFAKGPGAAIHSFLAPTRHVIGVGAFDETLRTNEDWDLWVRLARSGTRFAVLNRPLAYYWNRGGSLTMNGAQVLADSAVVRERIRHPDPRLASARTEHGGALAAAEPANAAQIALLWNAGAMLAAGRDARALLDPWSAAMPELAPWMAEALFGGLRHGLGGDEAAPGRHWASIEANLLSFLAGLDVANPAHSPGLARGLLKDLERHVVRTADFRSTLRLTSTLGARLSPGALVAAFRGDDDAETVLIKAPLTRPRRLFLFAVQRRQASGPRP